MLYIYKGKIVENNTPETEIVRSYIFEENDFAHVILNDAQIEYYNQNKDADINDVWNLGIKLEEYG